MKWLCVGLYKVVSTDIKIENNWWTDFEFHVGQSVFTLDRNKFTILYVLTKGFLLVFYNGSQGRYMVSKHLHKPLHYLYLICLGTSNKNCFFIYCQLHKMLIRHMLICMDVYEKVILMYICIHAMTMEHSFLYRIYIDAYIKCNV